MKNLKDFMTAIRFTMRHPANKSVLKVFFGVLVLTAILFIWWLPAKIEHSSYSGDMDKIREMMSNSLSEQKSYDAFLKASKNSEMLENKISSTKSKGELASEINELARANGLRISMENTGEDKEENIAGCMTDSQEITVSGGYSGLRLFIYGIENMDSMAVLSKVKIENTGTNINSIKAAIRLIFYHKMRVKEG